MGDSIEAAAISRSPKHCQPDVKVCQAMALLCAGCIEIAIDQIAMIIDIGLEGCLVLEATSRETVLSGKVSSHAA